MRRRVHAIEYKEIPRVSPSQYHSMRACPFKIVLAQAFDRKPLLPVSANTHFGSVLHEMIELISKRVIRDEEELDRRFKEAVEKAEEFLTAEGHLHLVPLQKNIKDFGMKKVLLKRYLNDTLVRGTESSGVKCHTEKWFESKDGLVGGYIDLVIEGKEGVEIVDFKTGKITESSLDDEGEAVLEVKEQYKDQLKIYAQLYYENTGVYPARLTLVDLNKQRFDIAFTRDECIQKYTDAIKLLKETNESIRIKKTIAYPSKENCMFCFYRPGCKFYLQKLDVENDFNDVSGILIDVKKYMNGNVSILLDSPQGIFSITGFASDWHNDLIEHKGDKIFIFNIRCQIKNVLYSSCKSTIGYLD